ncbi:MAG: hypothetical protein ACRD40_19500 [Candidatus Acidiferrales bacterium]
MMRQALHIFKKDVRYLSGEILLVAALAGVFAWKLAAQWAEILLPIAAVYLIARLIHAEAIPGDRQLWTTRPYRWKSLLAAKVLFILAFVSAPTLLAQMYILAQAQLPVAGNWQGLLWSQFVTLIAVWLPIAALAAMTSSIVIFNFCAIALVAVGFLFNQSTFFYQRYLRLPDSFQWEPHTVWVMTIAIAALCVFYVQYKYRCTFFSRCFAVIAIVLTALVVVSLPVSWAVNLQSRLPGHGSEPQGLQLGVAWNAREHLLGIMSPAQRGQSNGVRDLSAVDLRIAANIPAGTDLRLDAAYITLQSRDGKNWLDGNASISEGLKSGQAVFYTSSFMPTSVFEAARNQPVTLRARVYFTAFGNATTKTIPLQMKPIDVTDGLQCNLAKPATFDYFECRSPFRWPDKLVLVQQQGQETIPLSLLISYSPFPAGINLDDAVETRWTSRISLLDPHITVIVKKPLHFRRDFEIDNLRLFNNPAP